MRRSTVLILCSLIFPILMITFATTQVGQAVSSMTGPTPIPPNLLPPPSNSATTPNNSAAISNSPSSSASTTASSSSVSSSSGQNDQGGNNQGQGNSKSNQLNNIKQVQSGLIASDPLGQKLSQSQLLQTTNWIFGGSAVGENASYAINEDKKGMHIGVQAIANGTWAGFYAASHATNAMLFHAVVSTPVSTIPYEFYENGLYVQTTQPFINYATCVSDTSSFGTVWAVVTTTGDAFHASQFNVLYVDTSPNQPLTRDCSIVTNGVNLLKVYLDNNLVYSNDTLSLTMPAPFNAFLEPETDYPGPMLKGTYSNYYALSNENMTVTGNPVGGTAQLVGSKGAVIASSPVDSTGTATFNMALFPEPLSATIKVYNSTSTLVGSSKNLSIYGGDVYTFSP